MHMLRFWVQAATSAAGLYAATSAAGFRAATSAAGFRAATRAAGFRAATRAAGFRAATRAAGLGLVLVAAFGCAASPLARPVVIGASVSDGVGATTPAAQANDPTLTVVDLATALDAWFVPPRASVESYADGSTFLDPVESIQAQVAEAKRKTATLVIAVDALFWTLYAKAASEGERELRFHAVLDSLGTLTVPLVVGDVPDMQSSAGSMLHPDQRPSTECLARTNDELRAWAAARTNVTLLPLSALVAHAERGEPVTVRGRTFVGDEARGLIGRDGLHASAEGVMALAGTSLDALIAARVIAPNSVRASWPEARNAISARRTQSAPAPIASLQAKTTAVSEDLDRFILFLQLKAASDPKAIDAGFAYVTARPTLRAAAAEVSTVRDVLTTWPQTRPRWAAALCEARVASATSEAALNGLVGWSLIAAGMNDDAEMRASSDAWRLMLANVGGAAYSDGERYDVAMRVYEEVRRTDEIAAGIFWPDAVRLAEHWQKGWNQEQGMRRAVRKMDAGVVLPKAKGPREQAVLLERALRAAGRTADAAALHAKLVKLASVNDTDVGR